VAPAASADDAVAADLAGACLPHDLDVDSALASGVQLSLSTPTAATAVPTEQRLVVFAQGLNLHAATAVDGRDRKRLERVCKYLVRPAFSLDAVRSKIPDDPYTLHAYTHS
jgi:hypothetical protein